MQITNESVAMRRLPPLLLLKPEPIKAAPEKGEWREGPQGAGVTKISITKIFNSLQPAFTKLIAFYKFGGLSHVLRV